MRHHKKNARHQFWSVKAIAKRHRIKAEARLPESKPLPKYLLPRARGESQVSIDDGQGASGWQNAPVRVPAFLRTLLATSVKQTAKDVKRARYERMMQRRSHQERSDAG